MIVALCRPRNIFRHSVLHATLHLNPCRPGHELMYGFSEFACSLNEPEEGIAPTDSRLRPDQRIMENGDFDGANTEKVRGFCQP